MTYINWKPSHHITTTHNGSENKESACNLGDLGSIPGLGRSPEEENGNPLQWEYPMDRAWWSIADGVTKGWTWVNDRYTQRSQVIFFSLWSKTNIISPKWKINPEVLCLNEISKSLPGMTYLLHYRENKQRRLTFLTTCGNNPHIPKDKTFSPYIHTLQHHTSSTTFPWKKMR